MFNIPKDILSDFEFSKLTTSLSTLNKDSICPKIEPIPFYNEELNKNMPNKEDISQESYKGYNPLGKSVDYFPDGNYEMTKKSQYHFKFGEELFYKGKIFDNEKNNLRAEEEMKIYKEAFPNEGLENLNDEESDEKKNENEIKYIYEIFGEEKENNKNPEFYCSSENKNSSLLNKKRNASKDKEQKKNVYLEEKKDKKNKNENLILKFLTNYINVFLYKKLIKTLGKIINVEKCDRKRFIKANENYLPHLLDKDLEEIFDLEKKIKLIEDNIKKFKINEEEEKKIKELLKSRFKEQLILYYESEELKKFKKKRFKDGKTPEDYDKLFYAGRKGKERGYYLLEPYGFIKYANSEPYCKNERKKTKK